MPLAPRSTIGLGGSAESYVLATRDGELTEALAWADRRRMAVHVLGGGSNLVVADAGVRGLTLQIALRGVSFRDDGDAVVVSARAGDRRFSRQSSAAAHTAPNPISAPKPVNRINHPCGVGLTC